MITLLWLLALVLIAIGAVGTVLPALPGAVLVFGGIALAAWIDDFTRISPLTLGVLAAMTILAWAVDFVAATLGARRAGASPLALAGAALGTLAGVITGLWGLLFMPLVGAAIGEFLAQRDFLRAGRVGMATWLGVLLGTAAKVAIVFAMIGVFVAALLL